MNAHMPSDQESHGQAFTLSITCDSDHKGFQEENIKHDPKHQQNGILQLAPSLGSRRGTLSSPRKQAVGRV